MSLIALASVLALQQPSVQLQAEMNRVFQGLVEISKPTTLPQIRNSLRTSLPVSRDETVGRSWFRTGAGWASITYTERGAFRRYSCFKVPTERRSRSDQELRNEALQAVRIIGFWGETCSTEISHETVSGARVIVNAHFGDMTATHGAGVEFAAGNLALESVFMWDRLDYARFRHAPRVTRQEAKQAAIEAYESFSPYAVARVSTVWPYLGIPRSAELRPPAWHEMSPDLLALCRQYVALPLYFIDFTDLSGRSNIFGGTMQTVVVDAMSGKAIVIYPYTGDASIAPKNKLKPFEPHLEVSLPSGETGTLRQVEAGPAVGRSVGMGVDGLRVQARFDPKSGLVFVPDGQDWRAYRPDRRLDARLRRPTVQRKPFGGGPNQPYRPAVG